jgi:hypothetical protein
MTEEEAAVVESGIDQNQWPIEISPDLFTRLTMTQVLMKEDGQTTENSVRLHLSVCE